MFIKLTRLYRELKLLSLADYAIEWDYATSNFKRY